MDMEEILAELLQDILGYLEPNELLNCRFVNRYWNHMACKYLKVKSKPISLVTDELLRNFNTCMDEADSQDFPFSKFHMNLSRLFKNDVETFASRFGIHALEYNLDLDFTGSTSTTTYYSIVEKVGILLQQSPSIEILRIKDENIEMDFSKFNFKQYFPSILPHLQLLEIKVDQLLRQSLGTKVHFGLLRSLIEITPSLSHFVINFIGNGFWNGQLSNLLIVMQKVPRISLINLSIRTEDVRRGNIQSLVAIKCQIQELSLVIMDSVYNPQLLFRLLYDWLETDGQILTKLSLKTSNTGFCLPTLKNLTYFQLYLDNKSSNKDEEQNGQRFIQRFGSTQFPKLITVHLVQYNENRYFSNAIFPNVTTLILDKCEESVILRNTNERWDRIFPNLKTLQLSIATINQTNNEVHRQIIPFSPCSEDECIFIANMKSLQNLEIINCSFIILNTILHLSKLGTLERLCNLRILSYENNEILEEMENSLSKFHNRVVIKKQIDNRTLVLEGGMKIL